jgi:hypothetical protein
MGDIQNDRSVTHYHLTCAELAVQKPRACYSSHTAGACCETCDRIKQPVKGNINNEIHYILLNIKVSYSELNKICSLHTATVSV